MTGSPGVRRTASFGGGFRAVFERDFLVLTSSGRYVLLRTLVIVALGAVSAITLANTAGGAFGYVASPDDVGRAVFGGFAVVYPVAVAFIGPALAAASVAGERSLGTLPLVLAAPVRPLGIVAAKFLSRLGALLVPLIGGLPIAAIAFLYGGISASVFALWVAVVVGFAAIAVASSVLASTFSRSVAAAISGAYLLAVALPLLESWGSYELSSQFPAGWLRDSLREHSVIGALGVTIEGALMKGRADGSVVPFLACTVAGVALCLGLSALRLGREAAAAAAGGRSRRRGRRLRIENPVADRATRDLPLRGAGWRAWISPLVISALTWLPILNDFDDDEILIGLNACTWITAIVLVSRASQSLAGERQQGSLALLLATPVGAPAIVRGKLAGLAAGAALCLLPGLALGIAGVVDGEMRVGAVLLWAVASVAVLFLFVAVALRVSVRASTTGRAAGLAFALTFGGILAHAFLLSVLAFATHAGSELFPVGMASPPAVVGVMTNVPNHSSPHSDDAKMLAWGGFWALAYVAGGLALVRSTGARLREDDA